MMLQSYLCVYNPQELELRSHLILGKNVSRKAHEYSEYMIVQFAQ